MKYEEKLEFYLKQLLLNLVNIELKVLNNQLNKSIYTPNIVCSFLVTSGDDQCNLLFHQLFINKNNFNECFEFIIRKLRSLLIDYPKYIKNNTKDYSKILTYCRYILDLMNLKAAPLIFFFNDGNMTYSEIGVYQNTTMQLNRLDIMIHNIILQDACPKYLVNLGCLPNYSLNRYISEYTSGIFLRENEFRELFKIENYSKFHSEAKNIVNFNLKSKEKKPFLNTSLDKSNKSYNKSDISIDSNNQEESFNICKSSNQRGNTFTSCETPNNFFNTEKTCSKCDQSLLFLCKRPYKESISNKFLELNEDIFYIKKNLSELGYNFRSITSTSLGKEFVIVSKETFESYNITASIKRLVEARIRESFKLRKFTKDNFSQDGECIKVILEQECQQNIWIHYEIRSQGLNKFTDIKEQEIKIKILGEFETINYLKNQEFHSKSNTSNPDFELIIGFIKEIMTTDMLIHQLSLCFNLEVDFSSNTNKKEFISKNSILIKSIKELNINCWHRFFNVEDIEVFLDKKISNVPNIICDLFEKNIENDEKDENSRNLEKNTNDVNSSKLRSNKKIVVQIDSELSDTYVYIKLIETAIKKMSDCSEIENYNGYFNEELTNNKYGKNLNLKRNSQSNKFENLNFYANQYSNSYIKLLSKNENKKKNNKYNGFCLINLFQYKSNLIIINIGFFQCFIQYRRNIVHLVKSNIKESFKKYESYLNPIFHQRYLILMLPINNNFFTSSLKGSDKQIFINNTNVLTYFPSRILFDNINEKKIFKYTVYNDFLIKIFTAELINKRMHESFKICHISSSIDRFDNTNFNIPDIEFSFKRKNSLGSKLKINEGSNSKEISDYKEVILINSINIYKILNNDDLKLMSENEEDTSRNILIFYRILVKNRDIQIEIYFEPVSGYMSKVNKNEIKMKEEKTMTEAVNNYLKISDNKIFELIKNIGKLFREILEKKLNSFIKFNSLNMKDSDNNISIRKIYEMNKNKFFNSIIERSDLCIFNIDPINFSGIKKISNLIGDYIDDLQQMFNKLDEDKSKVDYSEIIKNMQLYKEMTYITYIRENDKRIENDTLQRFHEFLKNLFKSLTDFEFENNIIENEGYTYFCKLLSEKDILIIKFPDLVKVLNCICKIQENNNKLVIHINYYTLSVVKMNLNIFSKSIVQNNQELEKVYNIFDENKTFMKMRNKLLNANYESQDYDYNIKYSKFVQDLIDRKEGIDDNLDDSFQQQCNVHKNESFVILKKEESKIYDGTNEGSQIKGNLEIKKLNSLNDIIENYIKFIGYFYDLIYNKNSLISFVYFNTEINLEYMLSYDIKIKLLDFVNISDKKIESFVKFSKYIEIIYGLFNEYFFNFSKNYFCNYLKEYKCNDSQNEVSLIKIRIIINLWIYSFSFLQ